MSTPASVNGRLVLPDGTPPPAGSFVQLDLKNYGTAQPTVDGVAIYNQKQYPLSTVDGTWSGTLYRNDNISCNGVFNTVWAMTYFSGGRAVYPAKLVAVSQASADLDTLAAVNIGTTPIAPTQPLTGAESALAQFPVAASTWTGVHNFGTQAVFAQFYDLSWNEILPDTAVSTDVNTFTATFLQPQAGFMVMVNVGNWTPSVTNPNYIIGNPTSSQSVTGDFPFTLGGSLSAKRVENIRYADQFAGSDLGAKINAADIDLGGTPGEICVNQAAGLTISTAVSLSANHILRFSQGGTYTFSAAITLGRGAAIVGPECSVSPDINDSTLNPPLVLKQANGANLAALIVASGNEAVLQYFMLDGNKSNNTTSVGIKAIGSRVNIFRVTVGNCPGDGLQITSTITGTSSNNEAINFRFIESSTCRNGGWGAVVTNTADFESRGSYYELNGSGGLRLIASDSPRVTGGNDFGGNNGRGIYGTGLSNDVSVTGQGAQIIGNNFGNNVGTDIYIDAYDSVHAGRSIQQWVITGNSFAGLGASATANTFDTIHFQDSGNNVVIGNVINSNSPNTNRYAIWTGSGSLTELQDLVGANSYSGTFGTGLENLASTATILPSNENGTGFGRLRNVYLDNASNFNAKNAAGAVASVWTPLNASDNMFWSLATGKTYNFQVNGSTVVQLGTGGLIAPTIGGGTTLARYARYTPTLSPVAVAANTTAEQSFASVLTSGDFVVGVSKPTAQAGLGIVGWRASGTTLFITFSNNTVGSITPTASEVYQVIGVQ